MEVLQVDKEIGDRLTKTFSLVVPSDSDEKLILRM